MSTRAMVSRIALIRAANLDGLEHRIERWGWWTWDNTQIEVVVSADGMSATTMRKR